MLDKAKWLEERRKGIGGSDAPAICGVSSWRSPLQVYFEKRGELAGPEDNEPMFWGRTLEPVIRQRYADVTGRRVIVPDGIIRHPRHDWMLASLDGVAPDDKRVVEVKTARSPVGWGEPGTDEIPEAYLIQVQHYMAVTAYPVADVAALIGGNDFRLYEVPADHELQEILMEKEAEFWKMVQDGIPPDPMTFIDAKLRFGSVSKAAKVQATEEAVNAIVQLRLIKELAKKEEALKAIIMLTLGESDTLVEGDKVLCTWKAGKGSKRFDVNGFKEFNPALFEQFYKEGEPSRRLLIK